MRQLFYHTEPAKKIRTLLSSKVTGTKDASKQSTNSRMTGKGSRKDLVFPERSIRMQKEFYVELSDRSTTAQDYLSAGPSFNRSTQNPANHV